MFLYYITDRTQFPGSEAERREQLLGKVRQAVLAGVDYIQLREKDLSARQLQELARDVVGIVRRPGSKTRLLINSRSDVALAFASDGGAGGNIGLLGAGDVFSDLHKALQRQAIGRRGA